MNVTPSGRPAASKPHGTLAAGRPQRLPGAPSGSVGSAYHVSRFASIGLAELGKLGPATTSTFVKSSAIARIASVRRRSAFT